MTETAALRALQRVDLEIQKWERLFEQLEERQQVRQSREQAQRCGKALEEAESELHQERRRLRQLEASLEELETEVESLQHKLFSGTGGEGPRELAGMQARLSDRQSQKLAVEEEIMGLWVTLEDAEQRVRRTRDAAGDSDEILQEHLRILKQRENQLQSELQKLKVQRQELVQKLPPSWLRVYQKLGQEKPGAVVVSHKDGRCLGCRVTLPSRVLRQGTTQSLRHCPHCGRILLDSESPDSQSQEG